MGLWGRFMTASQAFLRAFNERDNIPSDEFGWNEYDVRLSRYAFLMRWYNNNQYTDIVSRMAQKYRHDNNLYRHIRGIHNPTYRLVEMYVAKVYGGALNMQDPSMGAIPVQSENDAVYGAIKQLWKWSNLQTEKDVFVRNGSMLGDAAIKVVDNRLKQWCKLEVLNPMYIKDVAYDDSGNVIDITIEYLRRDNPNDPSSQLYTITETIDKKEWATYKNGSPFAFNTDMNGNPLARWDNPYGFVPVTMAQHRNLGLGWGGAAVPTSAFPKINECNDLASLIDDAVRKSVTPMFKSSGTRKGDIDFEKNERDNVPIMHIPKDTTLEQVTVNLDLMGSLANLQNKLQELENDMPELGLASMRQTADMSGVAIRNLYSDGVSRFQQAMGAYDDALVRAQMMALTIGGMGKYRGFESFNEQSYERGDLAHYIQERPVIDDALTDQQKADILSRKQDVSSIVLMRLMGVPDDIIEMQERYEIDQSASATRAIMNSIGFGNDEEDDEIDDNRATVGTSTGDVVAVVDESTG